MRSIFKTNPQERPTGVGISETAIHHSSKSCAHLCIVWNLSGAPECEWRSCTYSLSIDVALSAEEQDLTESYFLIQLLATAFWWETATAAPGGTSSQRKRTHLGYRNTTGYTLLDSSLSNLGRRHLPILEREMNQVLRLVKTDI